MNTFDPGSGACLLWECSQSGVALSSEHHN